VQVMGEWKKRALVNQDVVTFLYVDSSIKQDAPLVYIWDLDKTYLDTHFENIRGLWRTIVEKAFQKRNVPGTRSLILALNATYEEKGEYFPLFFISASPPQMEKKIKRKFDIDGLKPYGSIFKDNLKNLTPKRLWRLTNHFGFKLQALLQLRTRLQENVKQILWGDDSESDAVIYSFYSDICSRRLSSDEIFKILKGLRVHQDQMEIIFSLQEKIPPKDPVEKVYINLATDTDPDYYLKYGRRTVATLNSFQGALDLFQDGKLSREQVNRVAEDMIFNYNFTQQELGDSINDLLAREILEKKILDVLIEEMKKHQFLKEEFVPRRVPIKAIVRRKGDRNWIAKSIDYLSELK